MHTVFGMLNQACSKTSIGLRQNDVSVWQIRQFSSVTISSVLPNDAFQKHIRNRQPNAV